MRVLVTGADGSLGRAIVPRLQERGLDVLPTDLRLSGESELDVTQSWAVRQTIRRFGPTHVLHLAGAKHAPNGEADPERALEVNAWGTRNLVRACRSADARLVTASTCKAADPETVYGATKLIAERLTLGAGGTVARFYNVVESSGNVFELWAALPWPAALPVTPCRRYFIALSQALELLEACLELPPGRYTVDPGPSVSIEKLARALYPGRAVFRMPPRRGDRLVEPRCAEHEQLVPIGDGLEAIFGPHDEGLSIELARAAADSSP